ncbi:MAG: hydrolase [Mariprofundales bacterium]
MSQSAPERLPCGCPPEYPDWDNRDIDLGGSLMQRTTLPMFLHMPIGFEARLHRQYEIIRGHRLHERWPGVALSQTGIFRGQLLCPLQEERSPLHGVIRLPNPYQLRCKLIHGDIGNIKLAVRTMQSELLDIARMPAALYLAYLTCPACKEERGGNRIMILRHWTKSPKLAQRLKRQQRRR